MGSVLDYCNPRPEIIAGSFNPEVFTASLSPIIEFYQGKKSSLDSIYTDAEQFFKEATYPTQGLCTTLSEVFGRISGDATVPAIHRLETAFGGGKTHTLIACAHIAKLGKSISSVKDELIAKELLPEPGAIELVGIAGEEIPVHKPKGDELMPYTLWGEIAYQIGGESLYCEVEDEAKSYAAPGKNFFEKVFAERKVLIMLDELAQYAARLEAARPDGASQLAAFLLALHGYARNRHGIAVVLTLASATDAFANQTGHLAQLVSQVKGDDISEADALGIGEKAVRGVASVVARDAVQITPVHAAELSSVLAKRLFLSVDREGARQAASEYMEMYKRNSSSLPEEATRVQFADRMIANYPFHPTLIDFLNNKLTDAENFQGTRGVLRVLSLAVRRLWELQLPVPMIHACHLDLRSDRVVNELLGRTGSSDLLFVLNADVGGVDTGSIEGGRSNAELADQKNPHPQGFPYYEYTWKTVFLHSLVGKQEGLQSKIFGITEPEALFAVSFPELSPPQIKMALDEIVLSASYLRHKQGKYYADKEPTINIILARIRKAVKENEVGEVLSDASRKIITNGSGPFLIEHDVSLPEDIPDGKGRPILGVVSLNAKTIDIEAIITTKGPHLPREHQNTIFLLVPTTVTLKAENQPRLFQDQQIQGTIDQENKQRLENLARQVKAMRILADKPQNYGINPKLVKEEDFKNISATANNDLITAVSAQFSNLYYPSGGGEIVHREIRTGGGEGGAPFIELIRKTLLKDGKLFTAENTTQADLVNLSKPFFSQQDAVSLEKLKLQFSSVRNWPVLENPGVFEQIIRAGVEKGTWCLYRMGSDESTKPSEFYNRDKSIPLGLNFNDKGYGIVSSQGAKQRGWSESKKVDPFKIRDEVTYVLTECGLATVEQVFEKVIDNYGSIPEPDLNNAIADLLKKGRIFAYYGTPEQYEKPELIQGPSAVLYTPQPHDVLITPAIAAERNWVNVKKQRFLLTGHDASAKILPILRRLGSLYIRGANSTIDSLDLYDLQLKNGGKIRLQLEDVPPESMKVLDEFFEVFDGIIVKEEEGMAVLEILEPDDDCLLIKELKAEVKEVDEDE